MLVPNSIVVRLQMETHHDPLCHTEYSSAMARPLTAWWSWCHTLKTSISHLYASPIFTAATGSTHGYDVTDPNEIDPAIGGRAGFDHADGGTQAGGMGFILDIVPNHMSTSLENRWWRGRYRVWSAKPLRALF